MKGRRVVGEPLVLEPGDYGFGRLEPDADEHWYIRDPSGSLAVLCNHEIQEHDDGSITIRHPLDRVPSIETATWAGSLIVGEWS